ncbi:SAM-dependent methyltransferase [Dactylosporangium sp. NPDC051485]|uniref:SAM-dependent methyltransferase n=1 Tax=Dactylosporangium sp. NPDC051485 TaxID=3154846 RepID=UPI00342025BA
MVSRSAAQTGAAVVAGGGWSASAPQSASRAAGETGDAASCVGAAQAAANRVADALLGGARNFAVDRALADQLTVIVPGLRHVVRRARTFRRHALDAAVHRGCTQLLDLGAGIPTTGAPRWPGIAVYVDNDPVAVADLRRVASPGRFVMSADILAPEALLDLIDDLGLLRLHEPVTVLLTMVLHHLDDVGARYLLTTLAQRLAAGSRLIVSALTSDALTDAQRHAVVTAYTAAPRLYLRTTEQTSAILTAGHLRVPHPCGRGGLFTATVTVPGTDGTRR